VRAEQLFYGSKLLLVKRMQILASPLTPIILRRTLSSMVVACASGASIPVGSTCRQNNFVLMATGYVCLLHGSGIKAPAGEKNSATGARRDAPN
jgi:hypothetical protein